VPIAPQLFGFFDLASIIGSTMMFGYLYFGEMEQTGK
jgi:hypothetical protein